MRTARSLLLSLAVASLACGKPEMTVLAPADTGQLITIRNFEFLPQSLQVIAGSSVLIRNEDPFMHTVTSESAPGSYTPGAVNGVEFDTAPFLGTRTISIRADAPVGTRIPYYCRLHGATMVNQGELVVVAP
jgi:plastocyanin